MGHTPETQVWSSTSRVRQTRGDTMRAQTGPAASLHSQKATVSTGRRALAAGVQRHRERPVRLSGPGRL